jgi:hypothetical protein
MKKRQGKVSDETAEYTETHRAMLKICEEFYNGSDCDRGLKTTLQELPKQISSKTDFFSHFATTKICFPVQPPWTCDHCGSTVLVIQTTHDNVDKVLSIEGESDDR